MPKSERRELTEEEQGLVRRLLRDHASDLAGKKKNKKSVQKAIDAYDAMGGVQMYKAVRDYCK